MAEIVRNLCGVQAQDAAAAPLAIRARATGLTSIDEEHARVRERSIVRTWAMRGTLHLISTSDLGWLLALLRPGLVASGRRRRSQLGFDDHSSRRGVEVIRDALTRRGSTPVALTRAEIAERLAAHDLPHTGQAPIHLIGLTAAEGVLCLGPDRDNKPTYVLLDDWISVGAALPREQALIELTRRYLAAYAPATLDDCATWSGLGMGEVRTAWQHLAGELLDVEIAGQRGSMLKTQAEWLDMTGDRPQSIRLVPSFDPYLLGYRSRALMVAPEHAKRIHPGGGVLHPTLLVDGHAAGTWRARRSREHLEIIVAPFTPLAEEMASGLELEVADIGRFLGTPTSWSIKQ